MSRISSESSPAFGPQKTVCRPTLPDIWSWPCLAIISASISDANALCRSSTRTHTSQVPRATDRRATALDTWQAAAQYGPDACLTLLHTAVEGLVWRENKVAAVLHAALAKKVAGQVYDPLTATQVRCAAQCNHDRNMRSVSVTTLHVHTAQAVARRVMI